MAIQRYITCEFRETGVNLKNTGLTTIVPAQTGRKFIVLRAYAIVTAFTGSGTVPTLQVVGNINGDTAGVLAGPSALLQVVNLNPITFLAVGQVSGSFWQADIGSTAISVQATAAGTFTTVTGDFVIEGLLI